MPDLVWHDGSVRPPRPAHPFRLSYVWLAHSQSFVHHGRPAVLQYSTRDAAWVMGAHAGLVVTHWAECPRPPDAGPEQPWRLHKESIDA